MMKHAPTWDTSIDQRKLATKQARSLNLSKLNSRNEFPDIILILRATRNSQLAFFLCPMYESHFKTTYIAHILSNCGQSHALNDRMKSDTWYLDEHDQLTQYKRSLDPCGKNPFPRLSLTHRKSKTQLLWCWDNARGDRSLWQVSRMYSWPWNTSHRPLSGLVFSTCEKFKVLKSG